MPDTQTIALRAMQVVLTSVPAARAAETLDGVAAATGTGDPAGGAARLRHSSGAMLQQRLLAGRRMVQVSPQSALALVRAGRHPLEQQGIAHLLPRLQAALAGVLSSCHRAFGGAMAWSGEAVPKDKAPQAVLLGWLLRLLPLLEPGGWGGAPLELLPG